MRPCLLNRLLPVSYVFWPLFPICNFAFTYICSYTIPHSKLLSSSLVSFPFPPPKLIPLSLTFLRPQFGFSDSFVTVTGCRSVAHHSSWRASTLYPLGKVAQLYPWAPVPISVTFYNPHGLQRDCSFSQSLHRDFTSHIVIIFIYAVSCKYFKYLFCIADVYMFLQKKSFVLK